MTDLCSFYHLPSTVLKNPKHTHLSAVYSYYNVATSISFEQLMRDNLILARNQNAGTYIRVLPCTIYYLYYLLFSPLAMLVVDVFNALDVMENASIFDALTFGAGDGFLQYYLYNWKCPVVEAGEVGLVLL